MKWVYLLLIFSLLGACAPARQAFSSIPPAAEPAGAVALPSATRVPPRVITATPRPSLSPSATAAPSDTPSATPTAEPTFTPTPKPVILAGAGDIATCGVEDDGRVAVVIAGVIERYPDAVVFTSGDNVQDSGQAYEYTQCFEETWGRFKDRIHPSPGNHDYLFAGAANYYDYFGAAAGERGQGWYSYDLGGWHIVALNSNCDDVACGAESPQVQWLKADLAASKAQCTLAYWHHPVFSSGLAGNSGWLRPFYQALYDAGAEIVINGHDHDYERFAPQDADGNADPNGIREFVAGTGGAYRRPFGVIQPNSEARGEFEFGALVFTLKEGAYDWQFLPAEGSTFTDSGSGECH